MQCKWLQEKNTIIVLNKAADKYSLYRDICFGKQRIVAWKLSDHITETSRIIRKRMLREREREVSVYKPLPLSWEGVAAWEPHIPVMLHAQGVCHNLVTNNAWGLWDQRRALSSWPQPLRVCTGLYQEHQGPKWKKNKIINTFFGEKLINCSKFLLGMQFFRATLFFEKWKIYLAHYL